MSQFHQESIIILLNTYGFDLDRARVETVVVTWLEKYEIEDIIKAIVESIYQHRYKAVSVSNMLAMWQRNGRVRVLHGVEYRNSITEKLPPPPAPIPDLSIGLEPSPPVVTRKPLPKPKTSLEPHPPFQPAQPEIVDEERGKIDLKHFSPSQVDRTAREDVIATEHPAKLPPLPDRSLRSPTTNNGDGFSDFYYKLKAIVEGSNSA
jgi:hypothetical protein